MFLQVWSKSPGSASSPQCGSHPRPSCVTEGSTHGSPSPPCHSTKATHNLEKNHQCCCSSITHRLKVNHIIMYLSNPGSLPRAGLPPYKNKNPKNPNSFWSFSQQQETIDQQKHFIGGAFSVSSPLHHISAGFKRNEPTVVPVKLLLRKGCLPCHWHYWYL